MASTFISAWALAASTGGSITISKGGQPSHAAGDIMLATIQAMDDGGTDVTITPPEGWEQVIERTYTRDGSSEFFRIRVYKRIAIGDEVSAVFSFANSTRTKTGHITVYRPAAGHDIRASGGQETTALAGSYTAPSLEALTADGLLIVALAKRSASTPSGTNVPDGMTEVIDSWEPGDAMGQASYYQTIAAVGATGARTAGYTNENASSSAIALLIEALPPKPHGVLPPAVPVPQTIVYRPVPQTVIIDRPISGPLSVPPIKIGGRR